MSNVEISGRTYQLMTQKIARVISDQDNLELEALIEGDENVRACWDNMLKKYHQSSLSRPSTTSNENWIEAQAIIDGTDRSNASKSVLRFSWKWAGAAAAVIFILFATYEFWFSKPGEAGAPYIKTRIASKQTPSKSVTLTLAGGQVFDLSGKTNDSIEATGAHLYNGQKSLSYTASAGQTASSLNRLTVPTGLDYRILLSDGSEIWLNSATTLEFPFSFTGATREITLNGEAFLDIKKNPSKPFIVHTTKGDIKVLGTAFNINSYDSGTIKIALVEGSVNFSNQLEKKTIKPGSELIYAEGKGIDIRHFDQDDVLAWRKGLFVFNEASLPEIVAVMPRWFGIEVQLDNPKLTREKFTGVMSRNEPIKVFLENLKSTMNIDYYYDASGSLHFK